MDNMVRDEGGWQGVCSKKEKKKNETSSSMSEVEFEFNGILDDIVSQMSAWEKKMRTKQERKDQEILSLMEDLQQVKSEVENMKSEVCRLNSYHQDTVSQMEADWEKKMSTEMEKKDEENLSLRKALQQADSDLEHVENGMRILNRDHQDTLSKMDAKWEKKMNIEMEKKDQEIFSFKKALQQADSDLEHVEHGVRKLHRDHEDTVSQIKAEWEKKMNIEMEKKDQEILSLKKALQQADSDLEHVEHGVRKLNRDHQDTVCQMEAEWERKTSSKLKNKDEEIHSLKKTFQQGNSRLENIRNKLCEFNSIFDDDVSLNRAEWEKTTSTELEKKDEEILSLMDVQHHDGIVADLRAKCEKKCSALEEDTVDRMINLQKEDEEKMSLLTDERQETKKQVPALTNENCELLTQNSTLGNRDAEWATQCGVLQNQHLTQGKEKKTLEIEFLVKENTELMVFTATSESPKNRRSRTKKKNKKKNGKME